MKQSFSLPQGLYQSLILPPAWRSPIDWDEQFGRPSFLTVEIGFGLGETLVDNAKTYPQRNFVGIEESIEHTQKALRLIERSNLPESNIRILKCDCRVAFERLFAENTIDQIDCLFPCPWPKKRHNKHRLFSSDFLKLINSRLKQKAQVKIVTDYYPYFAWILEETPNTGFETTTNVVSPRYNTKYERKWQAEGQREFFEICLHKTSHIDRPLKKDVVLQAYKISQFNPQRFVLQNEKGPAAIIFKDFLFDEKHEAGLIYAIVSEEALTQHLRINISKSNQAWHIVKADGQYFFPTEGIARALQLVYEAALASSGASSLAN